MTRQIFNLFRFVSKMRVGFVLLPVLLGWEARAVSPFSYQSFQSLSAKLLSDAIEDSIQKISQSVGSVYTEGLVEDWHRLLRFGLPQKDLCELRPQMRAFRLARVEQLLMSWDWKELHQRMRLSRGERVDDLVGLWDSTAYFRKRTQRLEELEVLQVTLTDRQIDRLRDGLTGLTRDPAALGYCRAFNRLMLQMGKNAFLPDCLNAQDTQLEEWVGPQSKVRSLDRLRFGFSPDWSRDWLQSSGFDRYVFLPYGLGIVYRKFFLKEGDLFFFKSNRHFFKWGLFQDPCDSYYELGVLQWIQQGETRFPVMMVSGMFSSDWIPLHEFLSPDRVEYVEIYRKPEAEVFLSPSEEKLQDPFELQSRFYFLGAIDHSPVLSSFELLED